MTDGQETWMERLEALAGRIEAGQAALHEAILGQSTLLRLFIERLEALLPSQEAGDGNGPTLQEILAEVVVRLGANTTILRKLDLRLETVVATFPGGASDSSGMSGREPSEASEITAV